MKSAAWAPRIILRIDVDGDPAPAAKVKPRHSARVEHRDYYDAASPGEAILLDAAVLLHGVMWRFREKYPEIAGLEIWMGMKEELERLVEAVRNTAAFRALSPEVRQRLSLSLLILDNDSRW